MVDWQGLRLARTEAEACIEKLQSTKRQREEEVETGQCTVEAVFHARQKTSQRAGSPSILLLVLYDRP